MDRFRYGQEIEIECDECESCGDEVEQGEGLEFDGEVFCGARCFADHMGATQRIA